MEPFGAVSRPAEVGKREIVLFVTHDVRVDREGQCRVGVAELAGDPTHALACT
jgi:hypothetical protein